MLERLMSASVGKVKVETCVKFVSRFLQSPIVLCSLWFIAAARGYWESWTAKVFYNIYIIYVQSFFHTLEQACLYIGYPKEYSDLFLYGIPFTLLIAPFSLLPAEVGSALWCLFSAYVLYLAIKQMGLEKWQTALVIWLSYNGLQVALVFQQYNILITALVLFSFILVEKEKDFWAALMIVFGAMTKIYGIVGLVFILFSKKKSHFALGVLFWGIFFFIVPMIYTSPQYVIASYDEWLSVLTMKHEMNQISYYQDISFPGMIRKMTHWNFNNLWLVIPALLLYCAPLLRLCQYKNKNFRLTFLASTLLFFVLFSTGTEETGYTAALIGVGIWFSLTPTSDRMFILNVALLLFCFVLTACSSSGFFFPFNVRKVYITAYALKALPCAIIWFKMIWEMLTQNYSPKPVTPKNE